MIDWTTWEPRQRANLCFILREEKILLIRKKRGFGAGKINGPGGKVDPGESALESALRETFEELGIHPLGAEQRGELHFQFCDGYSLHCAVFLAHDFSGEPREPTRPFRSGRRSTPFLTMKCGRTTGIGCHCSFAANILQATSSSTATDC